MNQAGYGAGGGMSSIATGQSNMPNPGQFSVGHSSGQVGDYANFRALSLHEQREAFFGPGKRDPTMQAEDSYSVENRTRPWEWMGKNLKIRNTIIRKIEANEDFIIRTILPLTELPPGGTIQVSELIFNDHNLDRIPEQGVGRLTTQQFRSWETRIQRHGLAFMMEDGFAMTEMGLETYTASILQISNATTDTMIIDAYYNLLMVTANDDYYKAYGIVTKNPTRAVVFEYEKTLWSILSKTARGFWTMVKMGRDTFGERRITPDSLIMPFNTRDYLKYSRPETRSYYEVGPRGPDFFFGKGYIQQAEGLEIFESSMFPMLDSEQREDPLIRNRSIGEFWDSLYADNAVDDPRFYRTSMRDRTIHDNRNDVFREIKFDEIVYNSGLFDRDGEELPSEDIGRPFFQGFPTVGDFLSKHRDWLNRVAKNIHAKVVDTTGAGHAAFVAEWTAVINRANDNVGRNPRDMFTSGAPATADRYGLPMDDEDADSDDLGMGSDSSSSSSSSGGGGGYRQYNIKLGEHLKHLGEAADLSLDERVKSSDNPYHLVFEHYKASSSKASERHFTKIDLRTLHAGLNELYKEGGYDHVIKKGWVKTLQYLLYTKAAMAKVYDTFGNNKEASDFLRLLYQDNGYESTVDTSGYFFKASDSKSVQTAAREQKVDAEQVKQRVAQLQNIYPNINRVLPRFLSGAYVELLKAEGSSKAEADLNKVLIPLAERVVDYTDEKRHPSMVTPQFMTTDRTKNSAFLLRILQNIGNAAQIQALVAWARRNPDILKEIKEDDADTRNNIGGLQTTLATIAADVHDKSLNTPGATNTVDGIKDVLNRTQITGKIFKFFEENNVPYPIDFIGARPSMNYEMGSAILLKRGFETGATFFGEPNFQLTNDGNRKVLYGYFTCYAGARVLKRDNVHILHNVTCKRYVSGGGTFFFDPLNQTDRTNFASGRTGDKDMFVLPLYPGERIRDNSFDLCGQYCDDLDDGYNNSTMSSKSHYAMAETIQGVWGLRQRDHYFDIEYYGQQQNSFNTLVFRMPMFLPKVKETGVIDPRGLHKQGQGHWGRMVYEGVRADRCGGGSGYVREVDYNAQCMLVS